MDVVVVDAGGANIGSVCYALERLGVAPTCTADAGLIQRADRVVLPGVGAAGTAMDMLIDRDLVEPLRTLTAPLLGICLGMQLLFESSEEGDVECLGLLPGRVQRLTPTPGARIPHMGWNTLEIRRPGSSILDGVAALERAYFVHGFAAPVTDDCVASCTHGDVFAAVVQRGSVAGAQFHPERSASVGARILENFVRNGAR